MMYSDLTIKENYIRFIQRFQYQSVSLGKEDTQEFWISELPSTLFGYRSAAHQRVVEFIPPGNTLTLFFPVEAVGAICNRIELGFNTVYIGKNQKIISLACPKSYGHFFLNIKLDCLDSVLDKISLNELQSKPSDLSGNWGIRIREERHWASLHQRVLNIASSIHALQTSQDIITVDPIVKEIQEFVVEVLQENIGSLETLKNKKNINRQRVFDRALDIIRSSPETTVLDLSRECHTTIRTLENTFQDYLGVTPKRYLKCRRLNEIKNQLIRTNAKEVDWQSIYSLFGIVNPSRFKNDYYALYGEFPIDTLSKS